MAIRNTEGYVTGWDGVAVPTMLAIFGLVSFGAGAIAFVDTMQSHGIDLSDDFKLGLIAGPAYAGLGWGAFVGWKRAYGE